MMIPCSVCNTIKKVNKRKTNSKSEYICKDCRDKIYISRRKNMFEDYKNGKDYTEIGKMYGITSDRVKTELYKCEGFVATKFLKNGGNKKKTSWYKIPNKYVGLHVKAPIADEMYSYLYKNIKKEIKKRGKPNFVGIKSILYDVTETYETPDDLKNLPKTAWLGITRKILLTIGYKNPETDTRSYVVLR